MSPGFSGIPVKVLKYCSAELSLTISKFINSILDSGLIPDEWKCAIVTPLFKGKGESSSFDNYRVISVLTPIGKLFEKLLALK